MFLCASHVDAASDADYKPENTIENIWIPAPAQIVNTRLPSFQTTIDEVPANVTYLSKEALQLKHPSVVQDALTDIEGAVFYDAIGNGVDRVFSLRGFQEGSAVIFVVDGVRVNELDGDSIVYPLISMHDIESIQIDRGSVSPVYGSGAFAGVVHITTGRPSEKKISLFGGIEASSHRGFKFNQGISGTIPDRVTPLQGDLKYYFNSGRTVSDGFRDNGEFRITSFDIKAAYELPEERGRVHVGVKHVEDAISNPGEMTFDQYQQDPERTNKPLDGRDYRNTIVQFGADTKFWDNRILASILTSWRTNLAHFYGTTATFTDFVTGSNPDTDLVTTKTRATDLIWQLGYEEEWGWFHNQSLIGMETRNASEYALEQDAFGGNVNEAALRETDRSSRPSNVSLFWREQIKLFKRVIAHVGMRHDFFKLKTTDALTPGNNQSKRWSNSSVSTGLTVKPLRSVDLFANYSQGFRVPTISEMAPFSAALNTSLRPEQSHSYEAGTRIRFKDKANVKFSYFLIDLEDEIVFDSSSITPATPFGRNINIGKSRRTGVESRLELTPIQELDLYGSYTWTQATVRETDGGGALIDGRALGQIPEHRLTMGGDARPLKRLGSPYDGLRVGMHGVFTGKQHPTSFESASQATLNATGGAGHTIKSYTVWDFILSYRWKTYEIYFKVNNVFNDRYYSRAVSATSFGTAIYPFGTHNFVNPGAPREYFFGAAWEI